MRFRYLWLCSRHEPRISQTRQWRMHLHGVETNGEEEEFRRRGRRQWSGHFWDGLRAWEWSGYGDGCEFLVIKNEEGKDGKREKTRSMKKIE